MNFQIACAERERTTDGQRVHAAAFDPSLPHPIVPAEPLRIATISKADRHGGGASRVAELLADQLGSMAHQSVHFCNRPGGAYGEARQPFNPALGINKAVRLGHAVSRKVGLAESLPLDTLSLLQSVKAFSADIVHVHDTTTAISPITLGTLSRRLPVMWTLHDASPFTGGCIYPVSCRRFQDSCGRCPQHGTWPLDGLVDLTPLHRRLRKQVHASGRVVMLAPSRWMRDLAFSSGMFARAPLLMPNPVNTKVFAPAADKQVLRRKLGLPENHFVLVSVAGDIRDPRKGMTEFLNVATMLADLNPHVVLIGKEDPMVAERLGGMSKTITGFVSSAEEMRDWYGAADAFVFCSAMDNQPLTILESMACGIPTFGFAVGGAGELVQPGENGVMVPHGEVEQLSVSLREAFGAGVLAEMGSIARRYAVQHHDLEEIAARHVQLYRDQIAEQGDRQEPAKTL